MLCGKYHIGEKRRIRTICGRFLQIIFSIILLLLSFPVLLLAVMAIRLESRGSVFFKQKRMGKDLKPFTIYKLRTMHISSERRVDSINIQEQDRITKVGNFLRLAKIDELSQLVNVLKGDMNFIGPRPLMLVDHLHYSRLFPEFNRRYKIK